MSCQDFLIANFTNYLPDCHSENIGALQSNKKAVLFIFLKNTAFYIMNKKVISV